MINPENIIILYKSTKNAIHMMYGSWDKKHNRENFLPFLGQFLPFYLTNNPKNQNFTKMKTIPWDIIISYKCTKNDDHMLYCRWDTVCHGRNVYFSFWAIFCPFTPLIIWKIIIFEKWKNPLRYHHFTYCNKNYNHMIQFLRCGARQMERWTNGWIDRWMDGRVNRWTDRLTDKQTNRWTDRQKKWHIEVSAPPKKILRRVF